ncbi:MAG TPA: hypothetical protein VEM40_08595 [Nitrospirota bacterium]|nr:hypothetical protein [Nitrospirota bacterium]
MFRKEDVRLAAEGLKWVFNAKEQKTSEITIPVAITVSSGVGYRSSRR